MYTQAYHVGLDARQGPVNTDKLSLWLLAPSSEEIWGNSVNVTLA